MVFVPLDVLFSLMPATLFKKKWWMYCFLTIFFYSLPCLSKIISWDLCSDQWVLELLPASEISKISYISKNTSFSFHNRYAKNFPHHKGQMEEFLLEHSVIIADSFLAPESKEFLENQKWQVHILPPLNSLKDIQDRCLWFQKHFHTSLEHDNFIGELIKNPDKTFLGKKFIFYGVGGHVAGSQTLLDDIFTHLGFINVAKKSIGWHYASLEHVLKLHPQIVFTTTPVAPLSLPSQAYTAAILLNIKVVHIPQTLLLCSTPKSLQALITWIKNHA